MDLAVALNQIIEQVVVGKDRREVLPVVIAVERGDRLIVDADFAFGRGVQAEQQFDQRGFAATVFADDKHDLALFDAQVDWPQTERFAASHRRKA